MNTKEKKYILAAHSKNTEGPPIWMMRQAGRYMSEYQSIRKQNSFLDMIHNPELACEITLQPIDKFKMDAAILFSDILVTAQALGSDLDYVEKVGPVISNPTTSIKDIQNLDTQNIEEKLSYVIDAIKLLKPELNKRHTPLIGFAGAPFTVASYMVEGKSSSDIKTIKTIISSKPEIFHQLLDILTETTITYLNAQIKAGVDALQLFDTWACYLSWDDFQIFSKHYIKRIVEKIYNPKNIPIAIYTRGSHGFAPCLQDLPVQVLSLDWQCDLKIMRQTIKKEIALQGNLDPYLLLGDKKIVKERVIKILTTMKNEPGFIFNLGHGVIPQIDPEMVKYVVDLVKSNPV